MDVVTLGAAKASARKLYAPRPQTCVVLGDSLTEQGGEIPANPDTRAYAPWTWANMILGQAFKILGNLGVGGETTTQIRARIGAVTALKPGWVFLLCGTNNMGAVDGVETAKTDITAMLDILTNAGIRVVIGTIPPRIGSSYAGTQKADTHVLNAWIRQLSRIRSGVTVVDYFAALADTGGNFRATIAGANPTTDGVHLSSAGAYACGVALADTVRPMLPAAIVPYAEPSPGPNKISVARPGLYGTGTPPYTLGGASSGAVAWSEPARPNGGAPWKQVVVPNAGVLTMQANVTIGTALAVGDEVSAIVEYDVTAVNAEGNGVAVHIKTWNGSAWTQLRTAFSDWAQPQVPRAGVIRVPACTIPSGATTAALYIELRGGMTFRFDRIGLYRTSEFPV